MKILMVLQGRFPPDIRVEKEVLALTNEHEVHLLCARYHGEPEREAWNGVFVERAITPVWRRLSHITLFALRKSRIWESAISAYAAKSQPDVIHVHDLPLLGSALSVARRRGVRVVADLHENFPAMMEETKRAPLGRVGGLGSLALRILTSIRAWEAYERAVLREVDHVITVVEEARDRVERLGVSRKRLSVVGNYADMDVEVPTGRPMAGLFQVVYAGGFGPTRDLYTVIDAVACLSADHYPDLRVVFVGAIGRSYELLQKYAEARAVEPRVAILKWAPLEEVHGLTREANVGIVPHVKSAHTDTTIPHKLFQYMWQALPVIVSDCAPLERIVGRASCGLVYKSGSAESLSEVIASLYNDRERAALMGGAGHDAVKSHYNWGQSALELRNIYETFS